MQLLISQPARLGKGIEHLTFDSAPGIQYYMWQKQEQTSPSYNDILKECTKYKTGHQIKRASLKQGKLGSGSIVKQCISLTRLQYA